MPILRDTIPTTGESHHALQPVSGRKNLRGTETTHDGQSKKDPERLIEALPKGHGDRACPKIMDERSPMPIYEYRCPQCGNEFERLLKRTSGSEDDPVCPTCHEAKAKRIPSCVRKVKRGTTSESVGCGQRASTGFS
jgi:putative FmdB family regulatory protein